MGLGFLPWEMLPTWLLGPLMALIGAYLFVHTEPLSWRQLEASAFVVIGACMFLHGVRKLIAKSNEKKSEALMSNLKEITHKNRIK
ncbi:hypothetical protein [Collimonas sp.]|jgi:hypothetical protein|uniref:hypothetical protein n=1 Tax=Collimonas sp. TaxID=1963772 RepID=UPI002C8FA1E7|nr:hypothetical protein [Collimonas sp.]HWX02900.1 hypothetical protein [Collimonas sp.]